MAVEGCLFTKTQVVYACYALAPYPSLKTERIIRPDKPGVGTRNTIQRQFEQSACVLDFVRKRSGSSDPWGPEGATIPDSTERSSMHLRLLECAREMPEPSLI